MVVITHRKAEQTIDWYFEPSDRVIDNAVLKEIFKVPEDADLAKEVEKVVEACNPSVMILRYSPVNSSSVMPVNQSD